MRLLGGKCFCLALIQFAYLLHVTKADISYTIKVISGTSKSDCDAWYEGSDDPVWGSAIEGITGYLLMHGSGYSCPNRSPPQTLYTATLDCEDQIESFSLCTLAGDDNRYNPTCSGFSDSLQVSELGCRVSGCTPMQVPICTSIDCTYSATLGFDASGGHGVRTSNVVYELTRSGNCVTQAPTKFPTNFPTATPTTSPTNFPSVSPTISPTPNPTKAPVPPVPTQSPSLSPTFFPTTPEPTKRPTRSPTFFPTDAPTHTPTTFPTTLTPTRHPTTGKPTRSPTGFNETLSPTTPEPTQNPTTSPTTPIPTKSPTTSAPTWACVGESKVCGGNLNYTGPTCCVEGYACTWVSDELSICKVSVQSGGASSGGGDDMTMAIAVGVIGIFLLAFMVVVMIVHRRRENRRRAAILNAKTKYQKEHAKSASNVSMAIPIGDEPPPPQEMSSSRQPKFPSGEGWEEMDM